jgi:hypothetical protein
MLVRLAHCRQSDQMALRRVCQRLGAVSTAEPTGSSVLLDRAAPTQNSLKACPFQRAAKGSDANSPTLHLEVM